MRVPSCNAAKALFSIDQAQALGSALRRGRRRAFQSERVQSVLFRHADDKPTSEGAVKRLVEMRNLTAKAKEDFRLAPFIGIPWKPAW